MKIEWSDKHELCIEKFRLPEDVVFVEGNRHIQLFVQLNPNLKEQTIDYKIELNV